jgi:hypothetical protein
MALIIREILPSDAGMVREFNARLAAAGVTFALPAHIGELLQRQGGTQIPYQTEYVLTDGSAVHGGYILKHEQMFADGSGFDVGNYQLPLSEGIVDRRYAMVGLQLIRNALERQPRLYCLGMGSAGRPLPQLLKRLGWSVAPVPFFFRIEHAGAFAREIRWLRRKPVARWALDACRYTGVLAATVALGRARRRLSGAPADIEWVEVPDLPAEVDALFEDVRSQYGLLCDRRAAAMQGKLPRDNKLSRCLLYRGGVLRGWAVLSQSSLQGHLQFGNMSLGCIVDGMAAPGDVDALVHAASARLQSSGCDLQVSNQTHPAWIAALRRHGFYGGPSNFILALSPALIAAKGAGSLLHFTRADGDGPINL